jgi:hypothetical protein
MFLDAAPHILAQRPAMSTVKKISQRSVSAKRLRRAVACQLPSTISPCSFALMLPLLNSHSLHRKLWLALPGVAQFYVMASAWSPSHLDGRFVSRFLLIVFCAALSSPLAAFAAQDQKTFSSFEIEVGSRTGFFRSPAFKVSILGNGRVDYVGYDQVHWHGKRHAHISQDAVEQLVARIRASDFFDLPDSYANGPCLSVDGSEGSLRILLDGHEKSVGTCDAPRILDQLMAEAESAAQVWRWVVFDPGELRSQIAHDWSVPQHMPKVMEDAIDWDAAEIISIRAANGAGVNAGNGVFLMRAVRSDRMEVIRALLDSGADWKIEDPDTGESPTTAAAFQSPEMVKLFLDKGADPNAVSEDDHTMLVNAAYLANFETVQLLVNAKVDVNIRNKHGDTALTVAENRKQEYSNGAPETARSFQPIIDYLVAHAAVR